MNTRPTLRWLAAATIFLAAAVFCQADQLKPGDSFPKLEAQDQHETAYPMPEGTKHIAVSFSMGAGKKANAYFSNKGARFLPERNAVFLSNIYGMPGVARMFAMPKMQKYPHRIMLADEKGLLDDFPQEKGMITVFDIDDDGKITAIKTWDPANSEAPL